MISKVITVIWKVDRCDFESDTVILKVFAVISKVPNATFSNAIANVTVITKVEHCDFDSDTVISKVDHCDFESVTVNSICGHRDFTMSGQPLEP